MYDLDDPPLQPRRINHPGWGLVAGYVSGQEAGDPLPQTWMAHRPLCSEADPETFFPERGDHYGAELARNICQRCPITADCLAHNLEERYGIWGGTSEVQRRVLRGKRKPGRRPKARLAARLSR